MANEMPGTGYQCFLVLERLSVKLLRGEPGSRHATTLEIEILVLVSRLEQ